MCLELLVHLELVILLLLFEGLCLLIELLVVGLQLLGKQSDLAVFLVDRLCQSVTQLLNLFIELVLDLFGLLLLEQDLVLVVDLGLRQALIALVPHVGQTLLEAHLFRVVELLQVSQLLLARLINLINRVL